MNLYVFMGTHLPEIAESITFLASQEPADSISRYFIPSGLEKLFESTERIRITTYDSSSTDMDWIQDGPERTFLLIDPRTSLVPQLEALAGRLKYLGCEPDKVLTVVDSQSAEESPQLRSYLDACIYYSDICLLGNRGGASKAFIRNFQKDYERKCYPCLFLLMKNQGKPDAPMEILTPGIRRISQLFDLPEAGEDPIVEPLIEASCDLDLEDLENDPFRPTEESPAANASVPDVTQWIVLEKA